MAEALGASTSIAGIIGFALQITTTIQTYAESVFESEKRLVDIASVISSTASTLNRLQEVLEAEKATDNVRQGPKVFKDEGIKQIESIVAECDKVCRSIVLFILKAGRGGGKAKLTKDTLNMQMFTISSLVKISKWSWLEPRIQRCHGKLRWLNIHLMLYLQVGNLVRHQITSVRTLNPDPSLSIPQLLLTLQIRNARLPGSFDEEMVQRVLTQRLKRRTADYTKKLALRLKKVEEEKSSADDVVSIYSSTGDDYKKRLADIKEDEDITEDCIQSVSSTQVKAESLTTLKSDLQDEPSAFADLHKTGGENIVRSSAISKEAPQSIIEPHKSDSLTNDAEKENPVQEKMKDEMQEIIVLEDKTEQEKIFVEGKARRSASIRTTEDTLRGSVSSKASSIKKREDFETVKEKSIAEDEKKEGVSSFPLFQSKSGPLSSWLKRLFGNRDKFLHDWESQELEAFIVHKDSPTPVKLPFGHQRLTSGLKQVISKDEYLSWDQYLLLESHHHQTIDKIIADAKQSDSRQRTFLALVRKQGQKEDEDRILVFFSLGGLDEAANLTHTMGRKLGFSFGRKHTWELRTRIMEAELVKLRIEVEKPAKAAEQAKLDKLKVLKFKDAVGRKYSFPFDKCKTWAGMEDLIKQAFIHVDIIGPHVNDGHYDLVGPSGEIILPQVWEAMIEPEWAITMHMWPMPDLQKIPPGGAMARPGPRRRERADCLPPGQGRRGPPPPPPPGWKEPPPSIERIRGPPPPPPPGWVGPPPPPPPGARRRGPPPPPPDWGKLGSDDLIIVRDGPTSKSSRKRKLDKKKKKRRAYDSSSSSSSSSSGSGTDSDSDSDSESDWESMASDSEIDDDGLDEELQSGIDFEKEKEKAGIPLGDLLVKWTYATDTKHEIITRIVEAALADSDSNSDSDDDDDDEERAREYRLNTLVGG